MVCYALVCPLLGPIIDNHTHTDTKTRDLCESVQRTICRIVQLDSPSGGVHHVCVMHNGIDDTRNNGTQQE